MLVVVFVLSAALALAACAPAAPAGGAVDDVGRPLALAKRPSRIVSLAPNATELVYALGAGSRLVGVTRYCDWPVEAKRIDRVGGMLDPDLERIARLAPDLVLLSYEGNTPRLGQALDRLQIPYYVVRVDSVEALAGSLRRMGAVIGANTIAGNVADGLVRKARGQAGALAGKKILFQIGPPDRGRLFSFGAKTLVAELVRLAGAENLGDRGPGAFPSFGAEELARLAPDVVVVIAEPGALDRAATGKEWKIRAPRARLFFPPADPFMRPGLRAVEAVVALVESLR